MKKYLDAALAALSIRTKVSSGLYNWLLYRQM